MFLDRLLANLHCIWNKNNILRQRRSVTNPTGLCEIPIVPCANKVYYGFLVTSPIEKHRAHGNIREFKQITTAGATTAVVTEKVWGEYVSVVCQILSLANKAKYDKDERNIG